MSYQIKEIFFSLQGEGARCGRAAVFCRFAGCNLWSGREADRAQALCSFCDTDFRGIDGTLGGSYSATALGEQVAACWESMTPDRSQRYVVLTGGEPLLQLDQRLLDVLHAHQFEIAVETNGTYPAPPQIDWLCVSPKAKAPLVVTRGDELKLVYPQLGAPPEQFAALGFRHFFLQPLAGAHSQQHTAQAVAYCQAHPLWRLSVQMHQLIGIV